MFVGAAQAHRGLLAHGRAGRAGRALRKRHQWRCRAEARTPISSSPPGPSSTCRCGGRRRSARERQVGDRQHAFTANMFDNPMLGLLKSTMKWVALGVGIVALLVGFFLAAGPAGGAHDHASRSGPDHRRRRAEPSGTRVPAELVSARAIGGIEAGRHPHARVREHRDRALPRARQRAPRGVCGALRACRMSPSARHGRGRQSALRAASPHHRSRRTIHRQGRRRA